MKTRSILFAAVAAVSLAGCATSPEPKDFTAYNAEMPRSILVVPVVNHSNEVDAADLFYSTLAVPLAERGYYIYPAAATKALMEAEGLGDPGLVHETPTTSLAPVFGADAVLYVEVIDWKSKYNVLSSGTQVEFLYTLKSGRTNEVLWQDQELYEHSASGNSGNILADLLATAVVAAINSTKSDYTPMAMAANVAVITPAGQGLPFGPYNPNASKNGQYFPSTGTGAVSDARQEALAAPGVHGIDLDGE